MPSQDDVDEVTANAVANSGSKNRVRFGNREVQEHDLRAQNELRKSLAADVQAQSSARLIFNKISPPGAA